MKARHERLLLIAGGLVALGLMAAFVLHALKDNLSLFYAPAEVLAGKAPRDRAFRIGGLVEAGSLVRQPDGVSVRFVVTDMQERVTIQYKGILPDLFSEGRGVVAQGKLDDQGLFIASEVLAKHDENYMPPEVAAALEKAHQEGAGDANAQTLPPQQLPQ
ncbi:MAG: cytochrome c maturation protein CcmE [Zoogloeaceae bacterium]|jgi:cytochrome c-type biogenesis protein CcmE|nr:cytochrome c maturation protein CcmE [Zoogloeaceae bacterium]